MARGGRRTGTPGVAYTNRSDLNMARQPVQAPTGQPYGAAKAQMDAQRAVPLPEAMPGQFGPLDRPSERPNEPTTTGLPFGGGAGPEALNFGGTVEDDAATQVRALYAKYPNNDLLKLVEILDSQ